MLLLPANTNKSHGRDLQRTRHPRLFERSSDWMSQICHMGGIQLKRSSFPTTPLQSWELILTCVHHPPDNYNSRSIEAKGTIYQLLFLQMCTSSLIFLSCMTRTLSVTWLFLLMAKTMCQEYFFLVSPNISYCYGLTANEATSIPMTLMHFKCVFCVFYLVVRSQK